MILKMTRKTRRRLAVGLALLACAWLSFVGYVGWAMRQPPEVFGQVMAKMPMPAYFLFPFETMWTAARKGHVKLGDTAPDFSVQTLDSRTDVQLATLWASRPVVLVFGSYT